MRTHLIPTTAALSAFLVVAFAGATFAAPHHAMRQHERYSEACSTLAGQWNDVAASHHGRHFSGAKHQESIAARDCRSNHAATQKAGVQHYRTALRLIGVKPHA